MLDLAARRVVSVEEIGPELSLVRLGRGDPPDLNSVRADGARPPAPARHARRRRRHRRAGRGQPAAEELVEELHPRGDRGGPGARAVAAALDPVPPHRPVGRGGAARDPRGGRLPAGPPEGRRRQHLRLARRGLRRLGHARHDLGEVQRRAGHRAGGRGRRPLARPARAARERAVRRAARRGRDDLGPSARLRRGARARPACRREPADRLPGRRPARLVRLRRHVARRATCSTAAADRWAPCCAAAPSGPVSSRRRSSASRRSWSRSSLCC